MLVVSENENIGKKERSLQLGKQVSTKSENIKGRCQGPNLSMWAYLMAKIMMSKN